MADEKKGITVKIDAELHAEIKQFIEENGLTMAEFVSQALYNELHPKIQPMEVKNMGPMRTMAFQMPEDMFQKLKDYLHRHNLTQKEFVLGLVEAELNRDQELKNTQTVENTEESEEQEESEVIEDDFDDELDEDEFEDEDMDDEPDEDESEDENMDDEPDEDESEDEDMDDELSVEETKDAALDEENEMTEEEPMSMAM